MIAVSVILGLAAAAAHAAAPRPPVDFREKVRCVKRLETGSFVKTVKICHTQKEWQRLNENARRDAQELVGSPGQTNN